MSTIKSLFILFALLGVFQLGSARSGHGQSQEAAAPVVDTTVGTAAVTETPVYPENALECYQCNSMDDAGCDKNATLKAKYLKQCPLKEGKKAVGCWTINQEVDYAQAEDLPPRIWTNRKCAYLNGESAVLHRVGFGGASHFYFCNNTRCNHSAGVYANPILALLATLAVLLFAKTYAV